MGIKASAEPQAHWFTYDERMPIESNVNADVLGRVMFHSSASTRL